MVLSDPALRADWAAELEEVRLGMLDLRTQLASELQRLSGSDRFGFLAEHRGMFSRLGASAEHVEKLRADHAVYMVGDSRMNIAGLNSATVPVLAQAFIDAGISAFFALASSGARTSFPKPIFPIIQTYNKAASCRYLA